jgi:hypothetical protein
MSRVITLRHFVFADDDVGDTECVFAARCWYLIYNQQYNKEREKRHLAY